VDVLTDPKDLDRVKEALVQTGLRPVTAGVTLRSSLTVRLDEHDRAAMVELLQDLGNLEDVQNVYSNADIPADILARR
jgi:transcriptional/translational regulatory protein YebC/TACO1